MEKYKRNSFKKSDNTSNINDGVLKITLKTLFGLEEVLQEELLELGYENSSLLNRAVQIEGTWKDVYFLNLHIRCSISILVEIAQFRIRNEDELYSKSLKIDWTQYFDVDKTFAVKGAVNSNFFNHTQFPYLVVKDAIADCFRDKFNERPDVDIKRPQVLFDLYINQEMVTLSLNTSGLPLYQRGYRNEVGDAPLNEVLAAGLLRLAKWDLKTPILDPFCGSGTILIEAALRAANIPSQIERQHYAFKNFKNFDSVLWENMLSEVNKKCTEMPDINGSDISDEMVLMARRNSSGLPISRFINVKSMSFEEWKDGSFKNGIVISNPPYGERMGEEIKEMYEKLGDWMKNELKGSECWIISSSEEGFKSVGLRPDRRIKLYNGSLECSFRKYSIYDGSKRQKFNQEEY